jgi:hypothetical protein
MDWLEFISSMTKALAWPAAILAILLIFRKSIIRVLPEIRRLKAGPSGLELEWIDRKLDEAREQLEASQEALEEPASSAASEDSKQRTKAAERASRTFMEEITELADISPQAAVVEAYRRLESVLRLAITQHLGPDLGPKSEYRQANIPSIVRAANAAGILTDSEVSLIADLRGIRNAVTHSVEGRPDIDRRRALAYGELVRQTIVAIYYRTQSSIPSEWNPAQGWLSDDVERLNAEKDGPASP